MALIQFHKNLDARARIPTIATVAKLDRLYVVIGTEYGHWHTSAGDVRTWKSHSGASKAAKRYEANRHLV